ncbi:MAG: RnfABCDGE type electron transport complex subunit C [Deltaproteobacteria bacterium]|nr:RnfABCDGE type electron transport complex subunit C [Deltaproteobacteria bacterium]MBW2070403.1 RnfABCDGE type electron transport complex subunit C [Deltaproteobacteria bacterium]
MKTSFRGVFLPATNLASPGIEEAPPPQKVILPMGSDASSLCEPVVAVGDQVAVGQLVGRSTAFTVAPVHASISGKVTAIRPWPNEKGDEILSVIIESDGKDGWQEKRPYPELSQETDRSAILDAIKEMGVMDSGPPAVALHTKFAAPSPTKEYTFLVGIPPAKEVDTLIVNAIDAEPGMALRRAVLNLRSNELLAGLQLLKKVVGDARIILAITGNGPLEPTLATRLTELGVELFHGKDKYPLGLPPILIKQLTGREIPLPDGEERDVGAAVVNAVTLVNLAEAAKGKPPIKKMVSISGGGLSHITNVSVRVGTPIKELLDYLPGITAEPAKVIAGGAMTGFALSSLDIPLTKEIDTLILQTAGEVSRFSTDSCINCGVCHRYCPVRLLPNELARYCEYGMFDDAAEKYLFHCIECAICAYVCPAKRPLLQLLRLGKRELALREGGQANG